MVVVRLNARQMMELMDAIPELTLSRKPQCQMTVRTFASADRQRVA